MARSSRTASPPASRPGPRRPGTRGRGRRTGHTTRTEEPAQRDDHLEAYLSEITDHELLTAAEEKTLAREIQDAEVETWIAALQCSPRGVLGGNDSLATLLHFALPRMLATNEPPPKDLDHAIRSKFSTLLNTAKRPDTAAFARAARSAARRLRAKDLDCAVIDAWMVTVARTSIPTPAVTTAHAHARSLRDRFVRANLRLVVTMANRYDHGIIPVSDLIQEGNLGLMHAVPRFDPERGLRFSTYAGWWIRHAIGKALADKTLTVRVPVRTQEFASQAERAKWKLASKLGRMPTHEEIAAATKLSPEKLELVNVPIAGQTISLDQTYRECDYDADAENRPRIARVLEAALVDMSAEDSSEDIIDQRVLLGRMRLVLGTLTEKERAVVTARFGLGGEGTGAPAPRTLVEIGAEYGLSHERIRRILAEALGKMRTAMETP